MYVDWSGGVAASDFAMSADWTSCDWGHSDIEMVDYCLPPIESCLSPISCFDDDCQRESLMMAYNYFYFVTGTLCLRS